MLPFYIPLHIWWFAALIYLCAIASVVWLRFAKDAASQQVAQVSSVTCFVVMTFHLVHEITSGSGFWLAGAIIFVVLAIMCVFEPRPSRPTRHI